MKKLKSWQATSHLLNPSPPHFTQSNTREINSQVEIRQKHTTHAFQNFKMKEAIQ